MIDVLSKIEKLQQERGWSIYRLAEESAVNQSTLVNMFSRKTLPSLTTLSRICSAFGLTLSEFFEENAVTAEDTQILIRWRALSEKDKKLLLAMADLLSERN